jgi:hypothetical protein
MLDVDLDEPIRFGDLPGRGCLVAWPPIPLYQLQRGFNFSFCTTSIQ